MQRRPEMHVMVGVLDDGDGRVLIAKRPTGKHLAGRWEFPGGKLNPGESPIAGLTRELAEELGVRLKSAEPLIHLHHDYPDRRVLLDVWRVTAYAGTPKGLDSPAIEWVRPDALPNVDLLEADRPIITALRLPPLARCISGAKALREATGRKPAEALFWDPAGADDEDLRDVVRAARAAGHRVIVSGEAVDAALTAARTGADGMLVDPSTGPMTLDGAGAFLGGAICASPAAATAAVKAGAHFLVLAPGRRNADARKLGGALQRLGVPAYVGWYDDADALELARSVGAHGCAIGPA